MSATLPVLALIALLLGCSPDAEVDATAAHEARGGAEDLVVYVTNEPLRAMAERIGADEAEVHFPAPPGVDPAHWSPDAETVARYQQASLVLRSGAGYEPWIDRVTLPRRAVVDTSAAYSERLILEDTATHQHGPEGEHSHGATASTTWLDPKLASLQAGAVAEALGERLPEASDAIAERSTALGLELDALDRRLAAVAERLSGEPLLYSHPVYQYLERRYHLNGRSLHWEPAEAPADSEWRALERLLDEHPARRMLWEAEPLPDTKRRLGELGIASVVYAPCGNRCADDWLAVMTENVARLEAAVSARR